MKFSILARILRRVAPHEQQRTPQEIGSPGAQNEVETPRNLGASRDVIVSTNNRVNARNDGLKMTPSAVLQKPCADSDVRVRGASPGPLPRHSAMVQDAPALTRTSLQDYADAPGLNVFETYDRREVVQRILKTQSKFSSFFTKDITIAGDLDLCRFLSLTQLPDGLSVGGNLDLAFCPYLTQLPDGLSVGGDLSLRECMSITQLPDGLSVGGNLNLDDCTRLTQLPDGLSVGGSLHLSRCTRLTELPDDLSVAGSLYLPRCISLRRLPDALSVGGELDLRDCTDLTHLPDGLSVGGELYLHHCTGLTQLGDGLSVGGTLSLRSCSGLTRLPNRLSVGDTLNLTMCAGLTQLPDDLRVGTNLIIHHCTSITSLPAAITTWGPPRNGRTRYIDLTGAGLSAAVIARLQDTDAPGMQFAFGMAPAAQTSARFANLDETLGFWLAAQKRERTVDASQWQLAERESSTLQQFLSRLCTTADYLNAAVRPYLTARVQTLVHAIDRDAVLRGQVLNCISESLASCDDRVILIMNQVELAVRVRQAEQGGLDGHALRTLLLGLMQLDIVHAHARRKVASLRFFDEVEVYLAYEVGLREVLQLPVSTQSMLYAGVAGVTQQDLAAAKHAARRAVADAAQVAAYLATSSPWQHHLRRLAAAVWTYEKTKPKRFNAALQLKSLRCPLTLEPFAALSQPLVWKHKEVCVVYEAADFITHWVAQGFEPTTRQLIALDVLVRPG